MVYYSPIFTSVIPDLKLTTCSAVKFWSMLLNDLVGFLEHESDCRHWSTTSDYMKLQKLVKEVYERLSAMIDDKNFTGLGTSLTFRISFLSSLLKTRGKLLMRNTSFLLLASGSTTV